MTTSNDDYRAWYDEAMVASNVAGYVGLSAAQTIEALSQQVSELRTLVPTLHAASAHNLWSTVEFDAISRDFDYAAYLSLHARAHRGAPLCRAAYELLRQAFYVQMVTDPIPRS